jgi:hypothetical protein
LSDKCSNERQASEYDAMLTQLFYHIAEGPSFRNYVYRVAGGRLSHYQCVARIRARRFPPQNSGNQISDCPVKSPNRDT